MPVFRRRRTTFRSISPNRSQQNRLRQPGSLTASGQRVKQRDGDAMRRLIQPWQSRALGYYDDVPEIKYAAQFYSRAMSVLDLYVAEMDDQGELTPTENEEVIAYLDRIQDPGGGRSQMQSSYGRLRFLTGEAYLLVSTDSDTDEEQWEMLSSDELRVTGSGYTRYMAPSMPAENLREAPDDAYAALGKDEALVYRLWSRHPRYSLLADSTMRGVLDVCEELMLLTQAVRARARSRLAGSGILIVNGAVIPIPIDGAAADENPEDDPFIDDLTEAMTQPIADEGAASAVVPHVVRVDLGAEDKLDNVMKHLQIVDPTQLYPETGLRREAIERLAIGLDMPPEVLLGIADANHWTGWMIDEQTWKGHLQPVAQGFVDDLNGAYFRPTLREEGIEGWERYYITYDATKIINHPDRSKDAKDLYSLRAIGKRALREAAGFDEEDAPTKEELDEMIGVECRDSSLAVDGIPAPRGTLGLEVAPGELAGGKTTDGGQASSEATRAPPPKEPAQTDKPTPGGVVGGASRVVVDRILGASDLMLVRARELAGARLRNYAKRDPEAFQLIDGVPARQVAAVLGRDRVKALGAPPERELVAGGRDLLATALRLARLDQALADPLGDRIEQHAVRTLYDEQPSPFTPQFTNYIAGLEAGRE